MATAAQVKELRERTGVGMLECKKALVETEGDIDAAIELLRKAGKAKAIKKESRIASEGAIIADCIPCADDAKRMQGVMLEVNCETDFVARDGNFKTFVQQVAKRAMHAGASSLEALMALRYAEDADTTIEDARKELILKIGENINVRRLISRQSDHKFASYLHGNRIGVLVEYQGGEESLGKDLAMHIAAANPVVVDVSDVPDELMAKEREVYLAQAQSSGKPEAILEKMVEGRIKKFVGEVSLTGQAFIKDPSMTVQDLLNKQQAKVIAFDRFEVGEGIEKEEKDFAQEVAEQVKGS